MNELYRHCHGIMKIATALASFLSIDFSLKAQLISNAKQLNNTTRELRAMSRSKAKPMPSEKLYGITVHAEESDDEET